MFLGSKPRILATASLALTATLALALSGCAKGDATSPTVSDSVQSDAQGKETATVKPTLRSTPGAPVPPSPSGIHLPEESGHPNPVAGNTPVLVHFKEGTEAAKVVAGAQSSENPLAALPEEVRSGVEGAVAQMYCRIESSKAIGANLRVQLNCMLNDSQLKELTKHLEAVPEVEWAEKEQRGAHA